MNKERKIAVLEICMYSLACTPIGLAVFFSAAIISDSDVEVKTYRDDPPALRACVAPTVPQVLRPL